MSAYIVADSGALYALYDADDRYHVAVTKVVNEARVPIVVPGAILSEIDYLLREFLGHGAQLDFLDGLRSGAFKLEPLVDLDLDRCRALLTQYRDLDLGLAETAVMATAERLNSLDILTLDERDFRAVVSRTGAPFRLLPADR